MNLFFVFCFLFFVFSFSVSSFFKISFSIFVCVPHSSLNNAKSHVHHILLLISSNQTDYLGRNRYSYFQLCTENRLKAKPDSRPPLEHPKKGILLNGKWVKEGTSKFIPLAKGIWRLRTYVENLEFRPGNIKILKYGRGLGLIIEWMIASYKCASFVEQIIDVENERCVCCFNFVVFFFFYL